MMRSLRLNFLILSHFLPPKDWDTEENAVQIEHLLLVEPVRVSLFRRARIKNAKAVSILARKPST